MIRAVVLIHLGVISSVPHLPNLARHAKLTALNQLWIADITFIRLRNEFIYLAVVLDAYSRRVIGWELGRTLHAGLAMGALHMALSERSWKAEGLIHHSDRGVQYASTDYTDLLEQGEIQISMSRRGNPYDNARAERFMRTLKEEEVHGTDYRDLEDARSRIGAERPALEENRADQVRPTVSCPFPPSFVSVPRRSHRSS